MSVASYKSLFLDFLTHNKNTGETPSGLYEPIEYILQLGGKRLRPVLTLMVCDSFGTPPEKALPAALAIEFFHTFSLIHDDFMDRSPLRRGNATVHTKWDDNTAILSGDALLIMAYQCLEHYDAHRCKKLFQLFNSTARQLCEGQQRDIDFEKNEAIRISDYLQMIRQKTAVLVAAAMKMGAYIADADDTDAEKIYAFGENLGMAFQLQDDYLDVFGDPRSFGKEQGSDIVANKKTFLYLSALQRANAEDSEQLSNLYSLSSETNANKITLVTQLFKKYQIDSLVKSQIELFTQKAFHQLASLNMTHTHKKQLEDFGKALMNRKV